MTRVERWRGITVLAGMVLAACADGDSVLDVTVKGPHVKVDHFEVQVSLASQPAPPMKFNFPADGGSGFYLDKLPSPAFAIVFGRDRRGMVTLKADAILAEGGGTLHDSQSVEIAPSHHQSMIIDFSAPADMSASELPDLDMSASGLPDLDMSTPELSDFADLAMPDIALDLPAADLPDSEIHDLLPDMVLPPDLMFSCSDGMQNGQETDVDCGGHDCLKCEGGKGCKDPSDCSSNFCNKGKCDPDYEWANWSVPHEGMLNYDNSLGNMIKDKVTSLTWQTDKAPMVKDWDDAKTYCATLPLGDLGWRLPTVIELASIVDYTKVNPAINPVFTQTPATYFWTSSPYATDGGSAAAWYVDFNQGYVNATAPDMYLDVRCVH